MISACPTPTSPTSTRGDTRSAVGAPRRRLGLLAAAAVLAAPLTAFVAPAAADPVPGGPWNCGEAVPLSGLLSHEELQQRLTSLAERRDALDLDVVGESLDGRPLYSAVVGDGPRTLAILTQQHGDEPMGTEAAVAFLREISADTPQAAALREAVTVVVVPRINPDGFERYTDEDFRDGIDPRRNSADLDLNRLWGPDADPDPATAPEVAAVEAVLAEHQPDLVVDYHHQVTYRTDEGDMATMSVLWSTHPDVDPAVAADGRRAAAVVGAALERDGHATVTRYPESDTSTTARNGLGLDGYPALLIEQRGQQEAGQKNRGALVREALTSMQGITEALADGSFDATDPAAADALPARGERVDGCE
ncbi:M14 family zinc carboxypeptidase [Nocardioides bruguierae]|uniref:Peptidase M14 domain-containing protein n=1 Tax=Nocardioides bruguierae TaxID=2945102 RepID=A0A9X2IGR2_9ACTN|nr:M14 family zinc carboxypeptidase [Nocardioides bruguierae]MCM0622283.1 hypothetical protein [Nocardioides bruguierae]